MTIGWLRQRLFFFRRLWIKGQFRMPVIDGHRYTVSWNLGYPTQKRPSEPPQCVTAPVAERHSLRMSSIRVRSSCPGIARTSPLSGVGRAKGPLGALDFFAWGAGWGVELLIDRRK
jgi:hypothetical protein